MITTAERLTEIASELAKIAESVRNDNANGDQHRLASEVWWNLQNACTRVMYASIYSRQIDEPQCYPQTSKEQA